MQNLGRGKILGIETLYNRYRDIPGVKRLGLEVNQPLPSTAFVAGCAVKFNFASSENDLKSMTLYNITEKYNK
jgi:hypothetical protein